MPLELNSEQYRAIEPACDLLKYYIVPQISRVALCRDARSVRPSPLKVTELHVLSFDNGRTDRASLHRVTRLDRASLHIVTRLIRLSDLQDLGR